MIMLKSFIVMALKTFLNDDTKPVFKCFHNDETKKIQQ